MTLPPESAACNNPSLCSVIYNKHIELPRHCGFSIWNPKPPNPNIPVCLWVWVWFSLLLLLFLFSHKRTFCSLCSMHYLTVPWHICYIKLPLRTVYRTRALFVTLYIYLGVKLYQFSIIHCLAYPKMQRISHDLGVSVDLVLKEGLYNFYKTHKTTRNEGSRRR